MATIKLKKPAAPAAGPPTADRAPVRGSGSGVKHRPTLAQAQAERIEREAQYQERLKTRPAAPGPGGPRRDDARRPPAPARGGPAGARPDARPARAETSAARGGPKLQRGEPPRGEPYPAPGASRSQRGEPARGEPPRARPATQRAPIQPPSRPNTAFGAPPRSRQPTPAPRAAPRRHEIDDEPPEHAPGSLRLSKRMSELGIASRREADEWIPKGWVRVDGRVVAELGARVLPEQQITIDAKARGQQAQRVTVLINKPVGYVSGQAEDGYEPAWVLVKPENQWRDDRSGIRFQREHLKSLVPAGRLDIDSVGLLVLTQDGRVAKQLVGEDSEVEKEYLVRVEVLEGERLPDRELERLRHGLELDGEALKPARVEWVNDDQLRFVLTEGKKRQIRRMCEAVGLKVTGLKRVRIGKLMLGDLPTGQWRYLRLDESFV